MNNPFKSTLQDRISKPWKTMTVREKWIFSAKLGVMLASFGWLYGNILAPDEVTS